VTNETVCYFDYGSWTTSTLGKFNIVSTDIDYNPIPNSFWMGMLEAINALVVIPDNAHVRDTREQLNYTLLSLV
jgi:hypothetical protein